MADEPYFAKLSMIGPETGVLNAHLENTGTEELPERWVTTSATVTPAGSSESFALAPLTYGGAIPAGETVLCGQWDVNGWGDGNYSLSCSLVITDDEGSQRCMDTWEGVEFSVKDGFTTEHRTDEVGDAELGDEYSTRAPDAHDVSYDPVPYVENGRLVVSIRNSGTGTYASGSAVRMWIADNESITSLDRDVPPGDSWTTTFELPELAAGNHHADIALFITGGEIFEGARRDDGEWIAPNTIVYVCYQDNGPVDVLLQ